jgi:5-methylcytosine-specific restriction endonuclease McrA
MAEAVLVLNANYEPINVCDVRRAVSLILAEKAALVINGRGYIHSATQSFPLPSVIQLYNMIHRPRLHLKLTRREVFRRDNYTCQYCGKTAGALTLDHIIPRHLGGQHTWKNVVTACSNCNHRKGGRLLRDANMSLLRPVKEPPYTAEYIFGRHLTEYSEWEPYISGW